MSKDGENRRYIDRGDVPDPVRDTLGALKRRLTEREAFVPRETDSEGFRAQIESASRGFELKVNLVAAVEPATGPEPETPAELPANPQGGLMPLLGESPHSPDHREYIETVVTTALPRVRKAFQNRGIVLPSDDEILQQMIMTNRFRPEQIEALIGNIKTPGLIILPPQMQSFVDYKRFLDVNKKRKEQRDVFVSDNRRKAFAAQDRKLVEARGTSLAQYRFGIGEMAQELKNRRGKLEDTISAWQREDLAKVLGVPTPRAYAVLQGQASDLLDQSGWSILCEENGLHSVIGEDTFVSGGCGYSNWDGDRRVFFGDRNPGNDCNYARVRHVVVG